MDPDVWVGGCKERKEAWKLGMHGGVFAVGGKGRLPEPSYLAVD
jgi:hypothetical protein